ncbi:MAG: NADH:ubiquinone reductase (Na(+)-transporting) subunit D [Sphingobacteriaceae bacterium]|nr:NADH:ubiquinone reductase (Na(+)-transporting) subunit D [Sphingobacteriaceae bacterium]
MSAVETKVKEAKPLLSKKDRALMVDPLSDNNPITIQVLGICSALAVTTQMKPTAVMAISVLAVLVFANLTVSLLRNAIPSRIRIIVQLTVISVLVILVDQILQAFVYDVSKQLSVFVGLIITNCIIMGRLEAFAMGNKPGPSVLDALGNAAGYGWIILAVAFARELFGSGKLFGFQVIPDAVYQMGYVNNGLMLIPAGALFVIAIIIWIQRSINQKFEEA